MFCSTAFIREFNYFKQWSEKAGLYVVTEFGTIPFKNLKLNKEFLSVDHLFDYLYNTISTPLLLNGVLIDDYKELCKSILYPDYFQNTVKINFSYSEIVSNFGYSNIYDEWYFYQDDKIIKIFCLNIEDMLISYNNDSVFQMSNILQQLTDEELPNLSFLSL